MVRVELRQIGVGAFVAAIVLALASCNGGTSSGVSTPTATPTTPPTGPPTPPPSLTPPPSTTPTVAPTPTPTVTGADALITFTGSFQFGPFSIDQFPNGVAIVTQSTGQTRQIVPINLVHTFFHDLSQNLPVNKIPVGTCPKPTTAPTDETTLTYQNETSGDISCPGNNAKTKILYNDVVSIENALGLRSMLRKRHRL